jgi:glycosyltransferase involved in cell wall biosynthesis
LKIGMIHSYYRSNLVSGENMVVNEIRQMLMEERFDVETWTSSSDEVSRNSKSKIKALIRALIHDNSKSQFQIWLNNQDSLQIHNLYPSLTRDKVEVINQSSIEVVRVVHNHRMSCLNGLHFRDNKSCFDCIQANNFIPAIRNSCYQDSMVNSAVMAKVHASTSTKVTERVDRYVAVSKYIEKYLISIGIEKDKISTIPNFIHSRPRVSAEAREVMYSGRAEGSKGAQHVLNLWKSDQELPTVNFIGDGDLMGDLVNASKLDNRIVVHGNLTPVEQEKIAQRCSVSIVPSMTNEAFGRTAIEALARGQSLLVTKKGALIDLLDKGIAKPFDGNDLTKSSYTLRECIDSFSQDTISHSVNFWQEFYSPEIISKQWREFYKR